MNTNEMNPKIDENTVPWLPTAIRYGLYGGLFSIIYSLLANMFDFAVPTSIGLLALQFLVLIGITVTILILALRQHREKELGGLMSFKRGFLVGFIALFVGGIISTLFQLLYFNVIDPEFASEAMDKMEELFEKFNMPEDQMEQQLADAEENFTNAGILKQGFISGPIFSAVMAAIFGAIMKKKDPFAS